MSNAGGNGFRSMHPHCAHRCCARSSMALPFNHADALHHIAKSGHEDNSSTQMSLRSV